MNEVRSSLGLFCGCSRLVDLTLVFLDFVMSFILEERHET
jgi:hypothetical protein